MRNVIFVEILNLRKAQNAKIFKSRKVIFFKSQKNSCLFNRISDIALRVVESVNRIYHGRLTSRLEVTGVCKPR